MLFKKKKISNDRQEYLELKKQVEKLLRKGWGPRCKLKDVEDFPEIVGTDSRCPACLVYEKFDDFWGYFDHSDYI